MFGIFGGKKKIQKPEPAFGEWTKEAIGNRAKRDGIAIEALEKELSAIYDRCPASVTLLPFEKPSIPAIKTLALRTYLDSNYDRISLDILRWKKKEGKDGNCPVFGFFDPFHTNECRLHFNGGYRESCHVGGKDRSDILDIYGSAFERGNYTAYFIGFVPDDIRALMVRLHAVEKSHTMGFRINLIAECDWQKEAIPPDPLVIATLGKDAWLIASFDTSPIEKIVSAEFSWKETPKNPI